MSVDVLQDKIRKRKNPIMLDLTLSPDHIPPQLRGTTEKVPLVFYFHGVNCVPLYGAEQSGWHDIADRENFILIYPAPAKSKCWNIYDLPNMPSDFAFVSFRIP